MQKDLHKIQVQILTKLLFEPRLRYTELRPNESVENNKLNFHIKQLKEAGIIANIDGFYELTTAGKEIANRIDTANMTVNKQASISAWVCVTRTGETETEYLIYTRLKHPFYGCQGFISGKIEFGENVTDAAKRELEEETNLQGNPDVIALKHYRVFDKSTENLVEDKFMFLCVVKNPTGEMIPSNEVDGAWIKESELEKYVTNPFETVEAFMSLIDMIKGYDGNMKFIEGDHFSEKF